MDVQRVIREFANGTSMHGVPRIINARSVFSRVFWSLICLGALGVFTWQCQILMERFFSYPKKVTIEIVQQPIEFPHVTVCNTDHLDLLVVDRLESLLLETNFTNPKSKEFENWEEQYVDFWDRSSNFFQPYMQVVDHQTSTEHMLLSYSRLGLAANLGVELASQGGIKLEDFIVSCRFMGAACDIKTSFIKYFDPYFYNCFTFDPASHWNTRANRLRGAEYGLTLILFMGSAGQVTSDPEQPMVIPGMEESDPALASGRAARVVVHTPGTKPHPASEGFDAAPGFSVTLGVQARKNIRIGQPHGNCTIGNDSAKYVYTLFDCQNECLLRNIMDNCGCIDNKISLLDSAGMPYCFKLPEIPKECVLLGNPEDMSQDCKDLLTSWTRKLECRKATYENMTQMDEDILRDCICHPPCDDVVYDSSYSLSHIPENTEEHGAFYSAIEAFLSNISPEKKLLLSQKYGSDYAKNMTTYISRINVHIADNNMIVTTEAPDYELIRLVSDVGGQLGLWIGISVVTLFEVLQLLADMCRFLTATKTRKSRTGARDVSAIPRVTNHQPPRTLRYEFDKLTTV